MSVFIENPLDNTPIPNTGSISFTLLRNTFGPDVSTSNIPMKLSYILPNALALNQSSNLNSFRGKYIPDIPINFVTSNAVNFTNLYVYEEIDTSIVQNTNFTFRKRDFKYLSTSNISVGHDINNTYDTILYLKSSVTGIGTTTVQISRENYTPISNTTYNSVPVSLNILVKKRNNVIKTVSSSVQDASDRLTSMIVKFNTTLTASAVQTYHGHHHSLTGYGGNGNNTCTHHGGSTTGPCHVSPLHDGTHHSFYSCGGNGVQTCTHHGGSTTGPCHTATPNNGQHHSSYPCGGNNGKYCHHSGGSFHCNHNGTGGYHHTGAPDKNIGTGENECSDCNKRNSTSVHHNHGPHSTGHGLYYTQHSGHNVNHTTWHHHNDCNDANVGHLRGHGCFHHGQHVNNCRHTPQHVHNCIHTNKSHHTITYRTSSKAVAFQNVNSDIDATYFTTTLIPDTSLAGSCANERTITYNFVDTNRTTTQNPHTSVNCTSRYKLNVKPNWINKTYTDIKGVSLTYN